VWIYGWVIDELVVASHERFSPAHAAAAWPPWDT
jgi:hypothetical protein